MLRLVTANGSGPSSAVLATLLRAKGVTLGDHGATATVSWGLPMPPGPRVLNGRTAITKQQELTTLKTAGVPCPEIRTGALSEADLALNPVWYGRKASHRGGTDIAVVTQVDESAWRIAAGWSYFTSRVPIKRELRVWMFRGRQLGTYEKRMVRPEQFVRPGRNHDNGFSFDRVRGGIREASEVSDAALTALGLDFGAADILETPDGRYVVLEVNTAPGIEHERRQCAINLADSISNWYRNLPATQVTAGGTYLIPGDVHFPVATPARPVHTVTNEQRFGRYQPRWGYFPVQAR